MREADDRLAATRVEVHQQDHLRAVGQSLLSLRALLSRIALGVRDRVLDPCGGKCLVEVLAVALLSTGPTTACPEEALRRWHDAAGVVDAAAGVLDADVDDLFDEPQPAATNEAAASSRLSASTQFSFFSRLTSS